LETFFCNSPYYSKFLSFKKVTFFLKLKWLVRLKEKQLIVKIFSNPKSRTHVELLNASFTHAFTPNSGNNNVTSLNELESSSRFVDKETQTIDPELCFLDKETQTKDPYSCCHPELSEKSSILTFQGQQMHI